MEADSQEIYRVTDHEALRLGLSDAVFTEEARFYLQKVQGQTTPQVC